MRGRVLTAAIVVGGAAGAACGQPGVFACDGDDACGDGECEPEGFCSFSDDGCDSGRRFGDHAGEGLAGACVPAPSGSDGSGTSGGDAHASSGSGAPPADTGSESTGLPVDDGSTGTIDPCPGWWDCAWPIRVPIEASFAGEALDGFPVRVALTPERFDFTASRTDGADVRVVDDAGRLLPFEIEHWDPDTSTAELWVRLPTLEDGARFWLYHGNLDAAAAEDPAAVFAGDFRAVWHLGPELREATGAEPLTDSGSTDAVGRIGRARELDGTSAHLRPAAEPSLLDVFDGGGTISAWILMDTFGEASYGRILDHASVNTTLDGWSFAVAGLDDTGTDDTVRFAYGYSLGQNDWRPLVTLMPGTWHHVAVTYVAGDLATVPQFVIDGAPARAVQIEIPDGEPNAITTTSPAIGALGTGTSRFFDGTIDELRVSSVARSPEWLAAEHASAVDEILSYQPPEYAP